MARAEPIARPLIAHPKDERVELMKQFIALALFLALGAAAQGKLAPIEPQPAAISPNDLAISLGAAGAALEQDYFRAPQPAQGGSPLCRQRLRIFDKTLLAQWCH